MVEQRPWLGIWLTICFFSGIRGEAATKRIGNDVLTITNQWIGLVGSSLKPTMVPCPPWWAGSLKRGSRRMDWLVGDDYGDLQEGATTLIGETEETHARTFSTLEDASVSVFAARRMKTRAFVLVGVKIELRSCLIVNVHSASAARQVKGMPDLSFYHFRETKTRKRRLIWKDWTLNIVNYLEYSPYVGIWGFGP